MSSPTSSVSLAELSSAGLLIHHIDAVTIAREAALRAARGDLPGVPAPDDLRLRSDGELEVADPALPANGNELRRAARLLTALVAHAEQDVKSPATFRLILARALAEDEAAYESLEQFAFALTAFAAPDCKAVVRQVVSTWHAKSGVTHSFADFATEAAPVAAVPIAAAAPRPVVPVPVRSDDATIDADLPLNTTVAAPSSVAPPTLPPRRPSRRWIPAVAIAALLVAALIPAWWTLRSRSAKVGDPKAAPQDVESANLQQASEPARVDPAASPQADAAAHPPALTQAPPPPAPPQTLAIARPTQIPATESAAARKEDAPTPTATPTTAAESAKMIRPTAYSPSFASATSGMFYHSGTGPGSAIMRADTDGSGMILRVTSVVNDRGSNFHPRPSPDGQLLAFDSDRDGERGIYVANAHGQDVRRVSGPGFAAVPSWSPDGRRLAFVRAEEGQPRVWNIWTVDMDSGEPNRVTSHRRGQPWGAAWFPEGDRIAYSQEERLILRTLEGKEIRSFKSPVPGRHVRTPAVSPDGKRIIFQVRRDGAWMLDLATGSMHRVLEDPTAEEFTWSPDGKRVAYHSRRSGGWGVWVMGPR